MITTFGAEVVVEDSCIFDYSGDQTTISPVVRIPSADGTTGDVTGSGNFVDADWECRLTGDLQDDLSLLCDSDEPIEAKESCTVSTGTLNAFW